MESISTKEKQEMNRKKYRKTFLTLNNKIRYRNIYKIFGLSSWLSQIIRTAHGVWTRVQFPSQKISEKEM